MPMPSHSEDLDAFRATVRAWARGVWGVCDPERDDDRTDPIPRAPEGHDQFVARAREVQRSVYAAGFAGMAVPTEYGGQGMTHAHEAVVAEELTLADSPSRRGLGIGPYLALPTILQAGSEAQRCRYIPKIIQGEELWCQLFSEPEAGSDLASLRTKAVLDGDRWVINGQKVWSSFASDADFGMLLARTKPDAPKPQLGISMFVLPMTAPGVTVRPLVDISGGHHFNEVFLTDVALGSESIIGEVHRGWDVANMTLGGERRVYMGGSGNGRRRRQVLEAARRQDRAGNANDRQRIVDAIAGEWLLERLRDRVEAGQAVGGHPAAGSLMKLAAGTLEQRVAQLVFDLGESASTAWSSADPDGDRASHALNASRQSTIAGGSHQIQRNLVGERILGLPR